MDDVVFFLDILTILLPNGTVYGYLVHFVGFGIFFHVLVCWTEKNLATLVKTWKWWIELAKKMIAHGWTRSREMVLKKSCHWNRPWKHWPFWTGGCNEKNRPPLFLRKMWYFSKSSKNLNVSICWRGFYSFLFTFLSIQFYPYSVCEKCFAYSDLNSIQFY
jgi:hypothetical protein